MIKEIDPQWDKRTWFTEEGERKWREDIYKGDCFSTAVTVDPYSETDQELWVVEWCGANDRVWTQFNIYPTREEAEAAAEMVFLTQPWR